MVDRGTIERDIAASGTTATTTATEGTARQGSASPVSSPVSQVSSAEASQSPSLKWESFLDPLRYELRQAHMKRKTGEQWGLDIASAAADVVQVTGVATGGSADRTNVELGAFVIAINGRRILKPADAQAIFDAKRSDIRMMLAVRRKPPWDAKTPAPVPSTWDKVVNHEYLLLRIDPTDANRLGVSVSVDRSGRVAVSVLTSDGAGMAAGLRIGDRIVTINGIMVTASHQFRFLVRDGQDNPFDVVIERPHDPTQSVPTRVTPLRTLINDEPGDPSTGVPQFPSDVNAFLGSSTKQVIEGIRSSARSRTVSPKDPKERKKDSAKVNLKKDVKKSKLKRDEPDNT